MWRFFSSLRLSGWKFGLPKFCVEFDSGRDSECRRMGARRRAAMGRR